MHCSLECAVDEVLARIDGPILLAMPLGLGKPNRFINALYRRIKTLPKRRLVIHTALSLGRPQAASDLERRLLEPFVERVFGDYPELDYLLDLRAGALPANVSVEEFYLQPGAMLGNEQVQQDYVSLNYSQVARELQRKGINLVAQLVARRTCEPGRLSLSCNTDVSVDLLPLLAKRRRRGETLLSVAQVHSRLPYMPGDAELAEDAFDLLIDEAEDSTLFSTPNLPVSVQDHCIGLHASALVRDGGTLQIGIGAMGDAVAAALLARHASNDSYRAALEALGSSWQQAGLIDAEGGLGRFDQGLYGCSEMFILGMLVLMERGVLRRRVYPSALLQRLANAGALDEEGRPRSLAALLVAGLPVRPDAQSLQALQRGGLLAASVRLEDGWLRDGDEAQPAQLDDPEVAGWFERRLSRARGVQVHGGFFLGPQDFYARLLAMDETERERIAMTGVGYINRLYGDESLKRLQRRDARFINSAFIVTLLGAGVADQLEDGRMVSGVGGQHDFVTQAHELEGGRSIIMLRSWRESAGEVQSNLRWQYGHVTIPRHLRDIVVTEYGIADLRGRSDAEVIEALLRIADSRFQDALIEEARAAGKLPADFVLPDAFRQNTPQRLAEVARRQPVLFDPFPLGSDFSAVERDLLAALKWLKGKLRLAEIADLGRAALFEPGDAERYAEHLARMDLADADGLREQLYRRLLLTGLAATEEDLR